MKGFVVISKVSFGRKVLPADFTDVRLLFLRVLGLLVRGQLGGKVAFKVAEIAADIPLIQRNVAQLVSLQDLHRPSYEITGRALEFLLCMVVVLVDL